LISPHGGTADEAEVFTGGCMGSIIMSENSHAEADFNFDVAHSFVENGSSISR
jgi:hypothetical protein